MTYRIVLINTSTKERKMLYYRFKSRKKAVEIAEKFKLNTKNADYEIRKEQIK